MSHAPFDATESRTTPPDEGANALPVVRSPVSPATVIERLEATARRGQLPGFEPASHTNESAFVISDFGHPFESRLLGSIWADGSGCRIGFRSNLKTRLIWVFAAILVLTVWPGVWLTDSMLRTYFSSYTIQTWWWYLPLTVPFVPLSLRSAIRRSRASAAIEALGLIEKVATALGGRVSAPTDDPQRT